MFAEHTLTGRMKAIAIAGVVALGVGLTGCAGSPTSASTGEYIDDTVTTAKVKAALTDALGADGLTDIEVETFKGTVQLSGFVDSAAVRARAETIVASIDGVDRVDNRLALK